MRSPAESSRAQRITLLVILLAGLLLRCGAIAVLRTYRTDPGAYEHAEIASNLACGEGFAYHFFCDRPLPTSHQAPAIPYLLSVAYRLHGVRSAAAHLAIELFLASLACVGIWSAYLVGRDLWRPQVGLWAAALFAMYPPLVYAVTRIQSINWSIPLLLAVLACLLRVRDTRSRRWALAGGILGGLGILSEPILAAAFIPGLLSLLVTGLTKRGPQRARMLGNVGILAGAAAVVITPWLARNAYVHGRPYFVKNTFWYVFWQGNHAGASGTDKLPVAAELQDRLAWRVGGPELEDLLTQARHQAIGVDSHLTGQQLAELQALPSEAARMDWFRAQALTELRSNPLHYAGMCLRRLGQLTWFDPTNPRAFVLPYRLPYLVLAGLAIGGLVLLRRQPAHGGWLALLVGSGPVLVFVLVITSARFRLLVEAMLLLPAALLLAELTRYLRRRPRGVA